MDSYENGNDSSSSKMIILMKNEKFQHENHLNTCIQSHSVWKPRYRNIYRAPQGLSEFYLYLVKETAKDFIDRVLEDSLWTVQCTESTANRSTCTHLSRKDECKLKATIYRQFNIKRPTVSDSDHLLSTSTWIDKNGIFDDEAALERISVHIKQNWNLDEKYLFTIKKTDTSMISGSTFYSFKAEFSVPTKEYPIPQVTVSAFFTLEIAPSIPIIYMKYQLETDRRVYVIGEHSFNKKRFEHLFEMKRNLYMDINRYPGWSSGPSHNHHGLHHKP